MSRFMELEPIAFSGDHYSEAPGNNDHYLGHHPIRWLSIYHVDEIIPATHTYKYYDAEEKKEKSETRKATYLIKHHAGAAEGDSRQDNRDTWVKVWGEAKDWVKRIDDAIDADMAAHHPEPEEEGDSLKVNVRGVWLPGELYAPLDLVQHPDDVSNEYMCTQESKSTDKETLTNTKFWCKVRF